MILRELEEGKKKQLAPQSFCKRKEKHSKNTKIFFGGEPLIIRGFWLFAEGHGMKTCEKRGMSGNKFRCNVGIYVFILGRSIQGICQNEFTD
jgi:hypothetical protein